MANRKDVATLQKTVKEWNDYIEDRRKARRNEKEFLADFSGERFPDHLDLREKDLRDCNFDGVRLAHARLSNCLLHNSSFKGADLHGSSLRKAKLVGSRFLETNLRYVTLSLAEITDAVFKECNVFGASMWGMEGKPKREKRLRVCSVKRREPERDAGNDLTVHSLEAASLLYAFSENERISKQLDALASRTVLILGRFTEKKKPTIETVAAELVPLNFIPVIFDFEPQENRDLSETITALAHLAKYIVADVGSPNSVPHELMRIVPLLPSVPVQPITCNGEQPWPLLDCILRYPWVQEVLSFSDTAELSSHFQQRIHEPCRKLAKKYRAAYVRRTERT